MRFYELKNLDEGVYDPHIFKAVFMAGGPGSGKSTVSQNLLQGSGIKFVDLDRFEEMARARGLQIDYSDPAAYDRFWQLAQRQKSNYLMGRLGLLIDGTAKDLDRILEQKQMLEGLGYDTAMVFVNTELEIAQQRVLSRAGTQGRLVPADRVNQSWHAAQRNLGRLQAAFSPNFFIVDNSGAQPRLDSAQKWVHRFLNAPPHSNEARQWIQHELAARQSKS